ncbi:hypothetical protein BV25DRAFT_1807240 [Artomyces pyxidatus]|uniref:Uncharacterized protein n=1 Tax=Artomyces pyxidatus TaxID=48021 RepID=A0ACB8SXQ1_9AGAM|nr:hypothetical protein BV25DRAFT_1807240 [Artomyces pyxidatus]
MDDKPVTFSSPVIPDCTAGDTTAIELVEKHHRFFFEDGNLIFTVEGILYCVHRYYFVRDSPYFASRLPAPDARTGSTTFDPTDEIWRGITGADIDAFLSILFPLNFDSCDICSVEAWASVLHLSTKWGFASIRRLALRNLVPITDALPVERLRLAREYAVEEWILPALTALCTRPTCPTLEEARRMVDADVVVVYTVREAILTSNIPDDDTEIAYQIRLWIKLNSASTPGNLSRSKSGFQPLICFLL